MPPTNRVSLAALVVCALALSNSVYSGAQMQSASAASVANGGVVSQSEAKPASLSNPGRAGFNNSISDTSQHDSTTGWSNILTPDLSFRFNRHFSADANFPWYLFLQANESTTIGGATNYTLTQVNNVIGDATTSLHFQAEGGDLSYVASVLVGYPTGDPHLGIGAGATTYNFNQHLDYSIGPFTPAIEVGVGNSTALANPFVRKSYSAVGALANFQAGTSIDLPRKLSLDVVAYEAMPFGIQSVFGTIARRGGSGRARGKQVLQGTGSAEDNGFTADLGIPLTSHLNLSGTYNRSLIQQVDIAGVSITWTFRAPRHSDAGAPSSPLANPGNR